MNQNYAESLRVYEELARQFPRVKTEGLLVGEAAANVLLERPEKAAAVAKDLLDAYPGFNLSQWRYGKLWKRQEDRTRLYDAAMKAGIPAGPKE